MNIILCSSISVYNDAEAARVFSFKYMCLFYIGYFIGNLLQ